jgi:ribosome-binding factor A
MKHRLVRVAEILKRELSIAILRTVPADGALITVNSVNVTPDLRHANVFVGVLGTSAQQREAMERLEKNRVILQAECAKRVVLKFTPQLHFRLDASIERGNRILNILEELEVPEEEDESS